MRRSMTPMVCFLLVAMGCQLDTAAPDDSSFSAAPTDSPIVIPAEQPTAGDAPDASGDAPLDSLVDECAAGAAESCDRLAVEAPLGSEQQQYGATCGDRVPAPSGSCVDIFLDEDRATSPTPAFSTNTGERSGGAPTTNASTVAAVRVAAQSGFDRFVIEITGDEVPIYRVYYDGNVLVAEIDADVDPESIRQSSEPTEILVGYEIEPVGPDASIWRLGVSQVRGFEVLTLTGPARLVIDVSQD